MAVHSNEWRYAAPRMVSEPVRQRETFKYDPSLLTTVKINNCGIPLPSSEIQASPHLILTGLAQLAVCQTGTERALISLFDTEYQYFIAEATKTLLVGPSPSQPNDNAELWMCGTAIPRAHSVCEHTLISKDPTQFEFANDNDPTHLPVLIVPDLQNDSRFSSKPYCQPGNSQRFYASVPIRTQRGINIGVLCVVCTTPDAEWNDRYSQVLRNLAVMVMEYLEANRSKSDHRRSERKIRGVGCFIEGKSIYTGWDAKSERKMRFGDTEPQHHSARSAEPQTTIATPNSSRSLSPGYAGGENSDASRRKDQQQAGRNGSHSTDYQEKSKTERKWDENFKPSADPMAETFSQAASLIIESLETDGCLFLDATLGSYGAFDKRSHNHDWRRKDAAGQVAATSSSSCSSGSSSEEDLAAPASEPTWPPCQVLGHSVSNYYNNESDDEQPGGISMAQKFLAKLLQRYPKGHIFNFDARGELQSSDSSDDDWWVPETTSSENLDNLPNTANQPRHPTRKPWARQNEGRAILEVFPGARSVAFVPVWDPRKQRWCAGGFIYTLTPTRIFTVHGELTYLRAFGILAIAETLRLKTLVANQAKTDALSSLSHELRSPLHGAVLGIELLREGELSVFQQNVAHTIETCCRTLVDTVDHLLDYSKVNKFMQSKRKDTEPRGLRQSRAKSIEAGMLSLYKHVRVDGLVEEVMDGVYAGYVFQHLSVVELGKHRHKNNSDLGALHRLDTMQAMEELPGGTKQRETYFNFGGISVFLDIDPNCSWRFYTQPGAIRRIVMNLFGNALKYTEAGTIKVCLSQTKPKKSRSPSLETMVNITVADTGKGMSEDYLRNELYKPFSQEDHLAPGTGLGLSFVKQITSQLRGRVSVESTVDVGTTVRVSLPLTRSLTSPDHIPAPHESEKDFAAQVQDVKGLRIQLKGFDAEPESEERHLLDGTTIEQYALLERICQQWLHMNVISDEEAQRKAPDLILWSAEAYGELSVQEKIFMNPPSIVAYKNARKAYEGAVHMAGMPERCVIELIVQPFAPRKLAKSFHLAVKRWKESTGMPLSPVTPKEDPFLEEKGILDRPRLLSPTVGNDLPTRAKTPEKSVKFSDEVETTPEFLLVEDNVINLKILSIYMKRLGRPYHTAMNGLEAVEAYKANPQQCKYIFMDISMPVMDGFEAARSIRAYERDNQLKPSTIFALTGLASESAQQEAFGSGVDLFLTKPVRLEELGLILKSRGLIVS